MTDCCCGPDDGERVTLNVQPVIRFKPSSDWNIIIHTVLPVTRQGKTAFNDGDRFGPGGTTQRFLFPEH